MSNNILSGATSSPSPASKKRERNSDNVMKSMIGIFFVIVKVVKIVIEALSLPNDEEGIKLKSQSPRLTITASVQTSSIASEFQNSPMKRHKCHKCERIKCRTRSSKTIQEQLESSAMQKLSSPPSSPIKTTSNSTEANMGSLSNVIAPQLKSQEITEMKKSVTFNMENNTVKLISTKDEKIKTGTKIQERKRPAKVASTIMNKQTTEKVPSTPGLVKTTKIESPRTPLTYVVGKQQMNTFNKNDIESVEKSSKVKVEIYRIELLHHLLTMHKPPPPTPARRRLDFKV